MHRITPLLAIAVLCFQQDNATAQTTAQPSQIQSQTQPKVPTKLTRQTRFGLPFNVNPGQSVKEVQLFVSNDFGRTWNLQGRRSPQQKGDFPFTSTGDGTYYFGLKTIDFNDRSSPPDKPHLGMIIQIDTKIPELSFNIHTAQNGKVDVWYRAKDQHLNPKSIEIKYRPHSNLPMNLSRWTTVPIESYGETQGQSTESRFSFAPKTQSMMLDIQAKIADAAGNVAVVNRQIKLTGATGINTASRATPNQNGVPPAVDPFAQKRSFAQNNLNWTSDIPDRPTAFQQTQARTTNENTGWQSATSSTLQKSQQQVQNTASSSRNLLNEVASNQFQSRRQQLDPRQMDSQSLSSNLPRVPKVEQGWQSTVPRRETTHGIPDRQNQQDMQLARQRTSTQTNGQLISTDRGMNQSLVANRIKAAVVDRSAISLLGSRKFSLTYGVDSIGQDGVSKVDIWITKDQGQSWYVWGTDDDRISPAIVTVDNDGLYGFRVGVTSQNGIAAPPPQAGDSPDVWVEVDTENPYVEITSAPYGQGPDTGKLLINWEASDTRLKSDPISLFYATTPDGPWQPITARIANSGQYAWKIYEKTPKLVYLRIEAIDKAGNNTVYIIDKPVDLGGLVPRGRIHSIQPVN